MFRHSAIETDRGESTVSVGFHRGRWSFYHRRSRTDTIRFVFRRRCYYGGNSGSYITSIGNSKSYKYWTEVRPIDKSLIYLI